MAKLDGADRLIGQSLTHFKVVERLGKGGMGIVYRALDTRLDRTVALKILPAEKMADPDRRKRFIQEARAASSLNHPNIVTIYDIGTAMVGGDPINYIAMEYVAGKTLHECIAYQGLPLAETLNYAVQIADALATAHAVGIIHRDLKPGNIMVNEKGLVKVLDFGLAKLAEPMELSDLTATLDITPRTLEGMIVGTVAYMSPEQAEGKKVDARSDIFSFGSVLYEMVTGQRAFHGETQMSTLAAILNKEPQPVSGVIQRPPRELERIIVRCLRKEPERRVQHMDDLKLALEELRDESLSGRHISRLLEANGDDSDSSFSTGIVRPLRRPRSRRMLWVAAALAATSIGALAWWGWSQRTPPPTRPPVLTRLTTDSGLSAYPALSADGKLLAYASDRSGEGNLDIWIQQVGGADPIRLTQHEADDYEPAFSPDGTKIAFRSERDGGGIYVIAALGGEERLIAKEGHRPRFSPDGNWIAYWTGAKGWVPGSSKIFIAPSGGGPPRRVHPEFASARHAVWMPDGKRLLFIGRLDPDPPRDHTFDWWIAPIDGGTAVSTGAFPVFRSQKLAEPLGESAISPSAVAAEGSRVLFSATLGDTTNLWQIAISERTGKVSGEPQRLSFGTGVELDAGLAAVPLGFPPVAFSSLTLNLDLWSVPIDANQGKVAGELRQLTRDLARDAWPSISADGKKLVFISTRSGPGALWLRDLETGKETVLSGGRGGQRQPKISGDGSTVAYSETTDNKETVYVISSQGGVPEKVCEKCGPPSHVSRNGQKILMETLGEGVILLDVALRKQFELLRTPGKDPPFPFAPRFSPDERWIAFHIREQPVVRQIFVAPFRGPATPGKAEWIPITDGKFMDREAYWSPDGNLLYFLSERDGFQCIWAQRLNPSSKRPVGPVFVVHHFHHARRLFTGLGPAEVGLSVGRDKMVFAMGELTGNVWMLKQDR